MSRRSGRITGLVWLSAFALLGPVWPPLPASSAKDSAKATSPKKSNNKKKDRKEPAGVAAAATEEPSELLRTQASILRAEDQRRIDEPLRASVQDQRADVRRLAVRAIGRIGDPSGRALLEGALRDEDADVRAEAVLGLGALG
ncbi:MAG TPA: HEAT repeat domain-containing protein, partial [Candidatus Polarisedimenticolaceae bacterium]|nr:HEAT repeat domain-containing protein [Candidatus Polarisedimenticolaceae bacterium]